MSSNILKHIQVFAGILLVLSIIYSSVLVIPYIYHDDAMFWFKPSNYPFHPYHHFNIFLGRFLGAFILSGLHQFVHSVTDLNIVRFMSVLQLSICGALCVWVLQRYLRNMLHSFLVAIMIFTLPPFQVLVSYAGISYATTAILLSGFAGLSASCIPIEKPYGKRIFNRFTVFASLLLFLALATYQSAAMFYWAMVMLFLVASSGEDFKNLNGL